jgi:hypothetical protein
MDPSSSSSSSQPPRATAPQPTSTAPSRSPPTTRTGIAAANPNAAAADSHTAGSTPVTGHVNLRRRDPTTVVAAPSDVLPSSVAAADEPRGAKGGGGSSARVEPHPVAEPVPAFQRQVSNPEAQHAVDVSTKERQVHLLFKIEEAMMGEDREAHEKLELLLLGELN